MEELQQGRCPDCGPGETTLFAFTTCRQAFLAAPNKSGDSDDTQPVRVSLPPKRSSAALIKERSPLDSIPQNRRGFALLRHVLGFQRERLPAVQYRLQRRRVQQVLAGAAAFDLIRLFIPSSNKLCALRQE